MNDVWEKSYESSKLPSEISLKAVYEAGYARGVMNSSPYSESGLIKAAASVLRGKLTHGTYSAKLADLIKDLEFYSVLFGPPAVPAKVHKMTGSLEYHACGRHAVPPSSSFWRDVTCYDCLRILATKGD